MLIPPELDHTSDTDTKLFPGIRLIDFGLSQYSSVHHREPVYGVAGTEGYIRCGLISSYNVYNLRDLRRCYFFFFLQRIMFCTVFITVQKQLR